MIIVWFISTELISWYHNNDTITPLNTSFYIVGTLLSRFHFWFLALSFGFIHKPFDHENQYTNRKQSEIQNKLTEKCKQRTNKTQRQYCSHLFSTKTFYSRIYVGLAITNVVLTRKFTPDHFSRAWIFPLVSGSRL